MNESRSLPQVHFGASDAITEMLESPLLLREGYYDLGSVESRIETGSKFLVLGYKGSGKSMIAARFRIRATDSPAFIACPMPISVRDLALADLKKVVPESFEAPARAHWAWVLFIALSMLEALETDGQADYDSRHRITEALKILRSHGILSQSPRSLQKFKTTKMTTTLRFPKFAEQSWEFDQSTSDQTINVWIRFVTLILKNHRSQRRLLLFIDGLDEMGVLDHGRGNLIGGLVSAAQFLNREMQEGQAKLKAVICCRTDLYERLELHTRGRIRSDYAVELNWYQNPREVQKTHLVQLAEQRAQISGYRGGLFQRALPRNLDNQSTVAFFGQATRHTPRDFLALLKNVQEFATSTEPMQRNQILSGMRQYSLVYFREEMNDALDSYFDAHTKDRVLDALGRMRAYSFTQAEFEANLDPRVDKTKALEALFECSFLGTALKNEQQTYFRFAYRNPGVRINNVDRLTVHPGLWKAFNLA